ncbi:MAG: S8 family serine peptidase [Candidatus Cloacimonetes bacterium]|nr:S8 family serine peptidase [Candidatus Cloacimonadota bacterium]
MFRPATRLGLLFTAACLAPVLHAGTISEDLRSDLSSLKPGETVSALISMSEQYPVESVDWDLHYQQVSRQVRHEKVVSELRDLAEVTQADLQGWLKSQENTPDLASWQSFWITNAVQVVGTRELIEQIARRSDVGQVNKDYRIENEEPIILPTKPGEVPPSRYAAPGLSAIGAPDVWALGYTGAGTLVCNIDTGVDGNHSALSSRWRGNSAPAAECFYDPVNSTSFPYDSGQHGTHTMGTITGMSTTTGDTTGVAFGAQWICAATIDHPGGGGIGGTITLALQSFQWAVDPDNNPGTLADVPDVISNSWGIPQGTLPQCDQTYWNAIDACEAAGTAVVFAAGNEGTSGLRSPSARATSIYSTFAIGALDVSDPNNPFVASFSSRGPSLCSADPVLQIKPEVSAPGVNVYSSIPGGGYSSSWSGTSMATPHVAGVISLMRSANPNLDVITIKQIIMDTGTDFSGSGDNNDSGHGMIDALACVLSSINGYGSVSGVVTGNGSPIPATVSVQGSPQMVTCDVNGNYSMGLPGDTNYVLEYSYFGYVTGTANISIVGDADVIQNIDLAAASSVTLSGTVFDPGSLPFEGAVLTVLNTPLAPAVSDVNGFYSINLPDGATYDVHATGAGLGEQTQTVAVSGNTTLDFNLPSDPRFSPSDPDNYGYRIYDSNDGAGAPVHVWSSISGTGTPVALSDDSFAAVAVPFAFSFYGATFNDIAVCSNGYVTAGSVNGSSSLGNGAIPGSGTPNNAVYGIWDDLNPATAGGTVSYGSQDGMFIVTFDQVFEYGGTGQITAQVILDSNEEAVRINYDTLLAPLDILSCTIGQEDASGGQGFSASFDGQGWLPHDQSAIWFGFNVIGPSGPYAVRVRPDNLQGVGLTGGYAEYELEVENRGDNASAFSLASEGNAWDVTFHDINADWAEITALPVMQYEDLFDLGVRVHVPEVPASFTDLVLLTVESTEDDTAFDTVEILTAASCSHTAQLIQNVNGNGLFGMDHLSDGDWVNANTLVWLASGVNRMVMEDSDTGVVGSIFVLPIGHDYSGIAHDSRDGSFWVSWSGGVSHVSASGALIGAHTPALLDVATGRMPTGLAFDEDGEVLWAICSNGAIDEFVRLDVSDAANPIGLDVIPVPWSEAGGSGAAGLDYNEGSDQLVALHVGTGYLECFLDLGDGSVDARGDFCPSGLSEAHGLALSDDGRLFVGWTNGLAHPVEEYTAPCQTTDVQRDALRLPTAWALESNYPNPFNPSTVIRYALPEQGLVSLDVYNMLGQHMQSLVSGMRPAGTHDVVFDGSSLSSGVYFYRIHVASADGRSLFDSVGKMMLIK